MKYISSVFITEAGKLIFPEQTAFKIRISEEGEYEICARLRPSGKSSFEEKCNPIQINSEEKEESLEEKKKNPEENEEDKKEEINEEPEESEEEISSKVIEFQNISTTKRAPIITNNTRLIINAPLSKNNTNQNVILKDGRNQMIIFYSFTAFCIIIIILLSMRYL